MSLQDSWKPSSSCLPRGKDLHVQQYNKQEAKPQQLLHPTEQPPLLAALKEVAGHPLLLQTTKATKQNSENEKKKNKKKAKEMNQDKTKNKKQKISQERESSETNKQTKKERKKERKEDGKQGGSNFFFVFS